MRYLILCFVTMMLAGCQPSVQSPLAAAIFPEAAAQSTSEAAAAVTSTFLPAPTWTAELPTALPTASPTIIPHIPTPTSEPPVEEEPVWTYRIVNEYPHDPTAYTQGLIVEDSKTLLEGTGRDSSLRRVNLETGEIEETFMLPDDLFGEGITLFEDRIIQLTWKAQSGFIYDRQTFEPVGVFEYPHEGWGITHDGPNLIVSDGTDTIRYWDPDTFAEVRRIQVSGKDGPVTLLNELEYVNDEIWANVWFSDLIVRISPSDGRVLGWVDLSGLIKPELRDKPEAVLNGIAYDALSGRIFITGKLWPQLFEIEVFESEEG